LSRATLLLKTSKIHRDYTIDTISLGLLIFLVLSLGYAATVAINTNASLVTIPIFILSLVTFGFILRLIAGFSFGSGMFEPITTLPEMLKSVLLGVVGYGLIALIQTAALGTFRTAIIPQNLLPVYLQLGASGRLLLADIAIAEETFFRGGLQVFIERFIDIKASYVASQVSAWVLTSIVFTIYHYVYYGRQQVLTAVFVSSLILCMLHTFSKRLSTSIISHVLVNAM
jgi:membrane protease YdiL (CAAX protease family)